MLYEKKMLILSGSGKGVVLIEKSGLGVRFALRTFDFPATDGLKAGVVTKTSVTVRDLPKTADPEAVFYIDNTDVSELHFAVFDNELRLYGATGKRMWESNLMGLLDKHGKPVELPRAVPKALPPISPAPKVLPLPDGTGLPQSRVAIYGDEALADSDFYTPFDIAASMPRVDSFLDAPRVLDGLAPRIVPPPDRPASPMYSPSSEITATVEPDPETSAPQERAAGSDSVDASFEQAPEAGEATEQAAEPASASVERDPPQVIEREAAASADVAFGGVENTGARMPWELAARWLKSRAKRVPVENKKRVQPVKTGAEIKKLRETAFFERAKKDMDMLFGSAPKDEELTALLPDIEWVKVTFDGHCVSVGKGGNAFICYAVAGLYEKASPLGDESQWLPKLKTAPTGKGYWLIFQDLTSGEIVAGA